MMFRRMLRAAFLDGRVYQELRDDPTATVQAFGVIVWSSTSLVVALILGQLREGGLGTYLTVFAAVLTPGVIGWVVVSLLAYLAGSRLLRRQITFPSVLRVIGFANTPGVFNVLLAMAGPDMLRILNGGILLWVLFAIAVGLRQSLDVPFVGGLWMAIPAILVIVFLRTAFAIPLLFRLYSV